MNNFSAKMTAGQKVSRSKSQPVGTTPEKTASVPVKERRLRDRLRKQKRKLVEPKIDSQLTKAKKVDKPATPEAMEVPKPETSKAMEVDQSTKAKKAGIEVFQQKTRRVDINQCEKPKFTAVRSGTIAIIPSKITLYPSRYGSMQCYAYIIADHALIKRPNTDPTMIPQWRKLDEPVLVLGAVSLELQKKLVEIMVSKTRGILNVYPEEKVDGVLTFKLTKNNI